MDALRSLVATAEAAARAGRPTVARAGFAEAIAHADALGGRAAVRARLAACRAALLVGDVAGAGAWAEDALARAGADDEDLALARDWAARVALGTSVVAWGAAPAVRGADASAPYPAEHAGNRFARLAHALEALPGLHAGGRDVGPALAEALGLAEALDDGPARAALEALAAAPTAGESRRAARLGTALAAMLGAADAPAMLAAAAAALLDLAEADGAAASCYDGLDRTGHVAAGTEPDGALAFEALWAGEACAADGQLAVPLPGGAGVLAAENVRAAGALAWATALAEGLGAALAAVLPLREAAAVDLAMRPLVDALVGCRDVAEGRAALAAAARSRCGAEDARWLAGAELDAEPAAVWVRDQGRPLHLVEAAGEQALALRTVWAVPVHADLVLHLQAARLVPADPLLLPWLARAGALAARLEGRLAWGGRGFNTSTEEDTR